MEQTFKPGLLKNTMTYGAILGVIVVIYSLIIFMLNILPTGFLIPGVLFIISLAIYFTSIFVFTKKIRTDLFEGSITYGQGIIIGTLIGLFAAIITSFYTYIQNTIIDPEYITRTVNAQKTWMANFLNGRVPDAKIEESLAQIDAKLKDYNAVKAAFSSVFWSTVGCFIVSLVTSAFLKKKNNPFENGQTA